MDKDVRLILRVLLAIATMITAILGYGQYTMLMPKLAENLFEEILERNHENEDDNHELQTQHKSNREITKSHRKKN